LHGKWLDKKAILKKYQVVLECVWLHKKKILNDNKLNASIFVA